MRSHCQQIRTRPSCDQPITRPSPRALTSRRCNDPLAAIQAAGINMLADSRRVRLRVVVARCASATTLQPRRERPATPTGDVVRTTADRPRSPKEFIMTSTQASAAPFFSPGSPSTPIPDVSTRPATGHGRRNLVIGLASIAVAAVHRRNPVRAIGQHVRRCHPGVATWPQRSLCGTRTSRAAASTTSRFLRRHRPRMSPPSRGRQRLQAAGSPGAASRTSPPTAGWQRLRAAGSAWRRCRRPVRTSAGWQRLQRAGAAAVATTDGTVPSARQEPVASPSRTAGSSLRRPRPWPSGVDRAQHVAVGLPSANHAVSCFDSTSRPTACGMRSDASNRKVVFGPSAFPPPIARWGSGRR